jgi:signal transduction histidine kinase
MSDRSPAAAGAVAIDGTEESIGLDHAELLAGLSDAIAHRFNNLLTVLLSSLEQLRAQTLDERGMRQLERAEASARQVGRLAGQLLVVARRDRGRPEDLELNAAMGGFDMMLDPAAGDMARVTLDLSPVPLPVRLDPIQLELALLGLLRDMAGAAPSARSVALRTAARSFDEQEGGHTVELSITDTACAIPPDLSTVERVVTAYGGKVALETTSGTTVRLVFPRSE